MKVTSERRREWFAIDNVALDEFAPRMGRAALAVYTVLSRFADYSERVAFPSRKTLVRLSGCSEPTVVRALSRVAALGLITITARQTADGDRDSNLYTLCDVRYVEHGAAPVAEPPPRHRTAKEKQSVSRVISRCWDMRS
jgi:DNA-binding transcriptional MocR family regulator